MSKSHLKAILFTLPLFIFGAVLFYLWSHTSEEKSFVPTLQIGEYFPELQTLDFKNQRFALSTLRGKVIIVNFWASWCSPCVEEIPSLIRLVDEMHGDLHLVAISADYSRSDIEVFLKSFPQLTNKNVTLIWDPNRDLMKKFKVYKLPESYILSPSHQVLKKVLGSIEWYTPNSLAYIKREFSQK